MSLYQKYRPYRFMDVVAQDDITAIIKSQVRREMTSHAYLFTGPSGVGKTSMARILSLALNCEKPRAGEPCLKCQTCQAALHGNAWDTIELDATQFRGIEGIRDLAMLSKFAPYGNYKVLLLEETHQLTIPAWNALLRLLEGAPKTLTIILTTTEENKVPETARSRCQLFKFRSLPKRDIVAKLKLICHKEKLGIGDASLQFIATMANSNLRTAETILEQVLNLNHSHPSSYQIRKFLQAQMKI